MSEPKPFEGRKTIATAIVGVITAWLLFWAGDVQLMEAMTATWTGLMAIFMRMGIGKPAAGLLLALVLLPGCWEVRQYDPETVRQIELTMQETQEDHDWVVQKFGVCEAGDIVFNSWEVLHQSRMARLNAWLRAERAKELKNE